MQERDGQEECDSYILTPAAQGVVELLSQVLAFADEVQSNPTTLKQLLNYQGDNPLVVEIEQDKIKNEIEVIKLDGFGREFSFSFNVYPEGAATAEAVSLGFPNLVLRIDSSGDFLELFNSHRITSEKTYALLQALIDKVDFPVLFKNRDQKEIFVANQAYNTRFDEFTNK